MKIAIDISPLSSGHSIRGVGVYVRSLKEFLPRYDSKNTYVFFEKPEEIAADADIVHYPYFDPFFVTFPLYKKIPTVITVHDLTPIIFPKLFPSGVKGKVKWNINKLILKNADRIITDSIASKDDVIKAVGVNSEKVIQVYLAAGDEFKKLKHGSWADDIKKKYSLPGKFALYVGDVTPNKNLPRLLEAALAAGIPLVFAGKALAENVFDRTNPWNKDLIKVQNIVNSQQPTAKDKIITLGFVSTEDLAKVYNLATVFVMPSLYEGFGLPILEAMSCGCPVITSKEGSLPEVAGDAAYFVDAYDINSIKNGIKNIMGNMSLQKELSEKGRRQTEKFTWGKTADDTITAYKSLYEE